MPNYELLKEKPFCLNDSQTQWVRNTIGSMTKEEKIGQLFCLISYSNDESVLNDIVRKYKAGGMMARPMPINEVCAVNDYVQKEAKIPLLIAANFEGGGDGMVAGGTNIGPNIQVGAAGDVDMARMQGHVSAKEGLSCGANWAFAPVIDINMNFRNPIIATRCYGSDPNMVAEYGAAYTKAAQEEGMAVSIKHFPGDGVDERDQHLVTSVNTLSCDEWDESFGMAYKASIDAGALTLMAGHIMQPAYSKLLRPDVKDEDIMPATLAPELLNDLLRDKLGFNGMIVTDASAMHGMMIPMPRKQHVPLSIAAGCDMFLFTVNLEEDYRFMTEGVDEGIISPERLDEAVMRILGVKQALNLIEKKARGELATDTAEAAKIVGCKDFKDAELYCADKAVTLVKNLDNIIPLSVEKYKRVLLYPINTAFSPLMGSVTITDGVKTALENEGFQVEIFAPPSRGFEGMFNAQGDFTERYDLLVYACNLETKSNQTTVRIEWEQPMGANVPRFITSLPTIFISFANPFNLIDVPRIRTFINAYKYKQTNLDAVMDKLMGRSEFKGVSPVDSFCGMWDTRL